MSQRLSLGYVRNFEPRNDVVMSVGLRLSINFIDEDLEDIYGDKVGFGAMLFFRIAPAPLRPHQYGR